MSVENNLVPKNIDPATEADDPLEQNNSEQVLKADNTIDDTLDQDSSEQDEQDEKDKLNFAEKIVDKNYEKINSIAKAIKEEIGINISFESIDKDTLRKALIITDEVSLGILKLGRLVDKRIWAISLLLVPIGEKEIEIAKRELEGEEISNTEKIKEKIAAVLPGSKEEDYENIDKAGELLDKLGDTLGGKKATVVKVFAKLLKNGEFQKGASKKFREWLKENEENGKDTRESIEEIVKEELAE